MHTRPLPSSVPTVVEMKGCNPPVMKPAVPSPGATTPTRRRGPSSGAMGQYGISWDFLIGQEKPSQIRGLANTYGLTHASSGVLGNRSKTAGVSEDAVNVSLRVCSLFVLDIQSRSAFSCGVAWATTTVCPVPISRWADGSDQRRGLAAQQSGLPDR